MTHRDPVKVFKSLINLLAYTYTIQRQDIVFKEFAKFHVHRERARALSMVDNIPLLGSEVFHVCFDQYIGSEAKTVSNVLRFANVALEGTTQLVEEYQRSHPRQGAKSVIYSLETFNLSESGLAREFAAYDKLRTTKLCAI